MDPEKYQLHVYKAYHLCQEVFSTNIEFKNSSRVNEVVTLNETLVGKFDLIRPVITSTDGLWVAIIK